MKNIFEKPACKTHNLLSELTTDNELYAKSIFSHLILEFERDAFPRDITFDAVNKGNNEVFSATIVAKSSGVAGGVSDAIFLIGSLLKAYPDRFKGGFRVDSHLNDGDFFEDGELLLSIQGKLGELLAIERTILNFLNRMCSVATKTKRLNSLIENLSPKTLLCATRKTPWGLIDKKAVSIGGGGTHRLGLYDSILVKDTNLDPINRDFPLLFKLLSKSKSEIRDSRFIEIEVLSKDEAEMVAKLFKSSGFEKPSVILLDNFNPEEAGTAIKRIRNISSDILIEISGGISDKNAKDYAKAKPDIISSGSLTSGGNEVDLSMKILNGGRRGT